LRIRVYDPLVGTEPLETLWFRDRVTVSVTDHPLIVEVSNLPALASAL
jgi:hypothetical protein